MGQLGGGGARDLNLHARCVRGVRHVDGRDDGRRFLFRAYGTFLFRSIMAIRTATHAAIAGRVPVAFDLAPRARVAGRSQFDFLHDCGASISSKLSSPCTWRACSSNSTRTSERTRRVAGFGAERGGYCSGSVGLGIRCDAPYKRRQTLFAGRARAAESACRANTHDA